MAQNTDLNVSPYYDDYDETKNFHRILFRPANAIQARELTQLQSIIQNQVERFGNHVFKEGSIVMGGTITVNKEYYAVKVNDANPNGAGTSTAETYRAAAVGKYYQGKTSGVVGKCINTVAATTDADSLTLFFTYVNKGTDYVTATFADNEEIEEVSVSAAGVYSNASNSDNEFKSIVLNATFTGSAATVRAGIFYTRGFFVRCTEQTILLDKYSNSPTYRVGLQIEETLISSTEDSSLEDNATGTSNENAPGANRLKINLTFVKKAVGGTQDVDNFIELSRVEAGIITKQKNISVYSEIEKTWARRTYDESGDYVVKRFELELREHLNTGDNNGVYLSNNATTPGDKTKFIGILSPGKAYVKGREVEKPSQSLLIISKARTTVDAGAIAVPFEIGNYYNINSVLGQPDFGQDSNITPYGHIDLYSDAKANLADATTSGTLIGQARCRYFNYISGTPASGVHTAASLHRIYLFDIRMFTQLTMQATMSNYKLTAGQKVVGATSGAKGTVATDVASGTILMLINVEGAFVKNEWVRAVWDSSTAIDANKTEDAAAIQADPEMAIRTYSSDRVRSLYQIPRTTDSTTFTADTLLTDSQFVLTGSCYVDLSGDATADKVVHGVNTKFTQEVKEGDVIVLPAGGTLIVDGTVAITDTTFSVVTAPADAEAGKFLRQRAQLQEQEKTIAISATPKDFISSISPNQVVVRRQKSTTVSSNVASSITAGAGGVLVAEDSNDYMITIMESAEGSDVDEGDVVDIGENLSGETLSLSGNTNGAITIRALGSTPITEGDQLKVTYAVTQNAAIATKVLRRARGVKVITKATAGTGATYSGGNGSPTSTASTVVYGTNFDDEMISLGVPDVYGVKGVFESNDEDDAIPPKLTLAAGMGTCNPGEKLTGSVSKAIGRVIQKSGNDIYFYYQTRNIKFTTSDVVKNEHNTDNTDNSRQCTAVTVVSKNITENYLLDDGQRDGYYALGSIKRKPGAPTPQRKLLIIFDYFTAGGGTCFTVNSYGSLDLELMPTYIPNIIDPLGPEVDGIFELSDSVDYRSYVDTLHDPSGTFNVASVTSVSSITQQPFSYKKFSGSNTTAGYDETFIGSTSIIDLPKSETALSTTAMVHYVPRLDKISLSPAGGFIVSTGEPGERPILPKTPTNTILLHSIYIPPYTSRITEIEVKSEDHRRFTMKDIGRIQGRVRTLERVTTLNALEYQANFETILDADGIARYKSGFVCDAFRGHRTGNVFHPDYSIAMDEPKGILRPKGNPKFFEICLNTDKSSGYQLTGDLITLPYTEVAYVTIDKASTTEFVNPYNIVTFAGSVTLDPSGDLWFDENQMALIKNSVMGNYDAILAAAGGVEGMGTVWNSWQTNWTGEPIVDSYWTREWVGEGQPDEHVTPDAQSTGFKGTPDFEP